MITTLKPVWAMWLLLLTTLIASAFLNGEAAFSASLVHNGWSFCSSGYDYDGGLHGNVGYDRPRMLSGDESKSVLSATRPLFSLCRRFLAAENAGSDTVQETYKALGIETSSTSTAPSRVYTVYQQDGNLFKFGVTDANLVRMNQSLEMAGPGSYARYTDVMPKYQAHLGEKYLRSLQYSSTGVWPLPGMKVPYPIDFTTKLPVSPQ